MIANNRMLNALRRAKSLIDYFEKQEQEKEEEQPEKPKEV